jgi:putative hydroxymethylpyrimidine transport system substrate-binding protein
MKKILLLLLTLFTTVSFAAEPKLQKLTVMLDWFPNPDHAPLIIAQQQGFFKEQGLDVELIGPADPTDPPKMVAAGKADIAITYEPDYMQQVDQGLPLIRVGTLIDKPLNCLVALKESGIKTLADLKGKRIGTSSGGISAIMLRTMLAKDGLTEKDVEIVNVKYGLTQALLSHKVDAVTGMMRNFEVPQLEQKDKQVVTFFPEENGVPNYSELVFVTNTSKTADARMPKFLAAVKKGVRYLDEHPDDAWKLFAKKYPEANNKVNHEAWFATIPYFAEEPAVANNEEWDLFAGFMLRHKLITKKQTTTRYSLALNLSPSYQVV